MLGYLAVLVTAVAFLLWYTTVDRIGADRAGLLTGIAPVSAAVVGAALLGVVPGPAVWLGLGLVLLGLAVGLPGRLAGQGLSRRIRSARRARRAGIR